MTATVCPGCQADQRAGVYTYLQLLGMGQVYTEREIESLTSSV